MSAALAFCAAALVLYAAVLAWFVVRIRRAVRESGGAAPRAPRPYWWTLASSLVLLVLLALVPLSPLVTAVVCASAVMGEYVALRERLAQVKKSLRRG